MNKTILSLVASFLLFQCIQAQVSLKLTIEEPTIRDYVNLDDSDFVLKNYGILVNEGSETVSIKWERMIVDKPEAWDVLVCDIINCYEPIAYSNIIPGALDAPVTLAPGDTTNLDVYIRPNGVSGAGEVRMDVSLVGAPGSVVVSGSYFFDALVSGSKEAGKARLSVFPNPASDYVQVQGAPADGRLVIYNILGRQVRSYNLAPGNRHYVGDLSNGLYLASVMNRKGDILKTFRISKRSLRP